MAWLEKLHHPEDYLKAFFKWGLLGLLMGVLGGLLGAGFHHALHFVTHVRSEHTWLIFLLPVGGLLTVTIYRFFKMQGNKGTNEIIDATLDGHPVSPMVAPSIFLAKQPLPTCLAVLRAVRAQHCSWVDLPHPCWQSCSGSIWKSEKSWSWQA